MISMKPSEEKPKEKSSEQLQPKPKAKPIWFHCGYCSRNGHKGEFCFKRKREERLTKKWANKDKYHPSNGVVEPHMQIVRTVPAWGDQRMAGGAVGCAPPVRTVKRTCQIGVELCTGQFGFRGCRAAQFGSFGRGTSG
jgi:hypothetical protein